MFRFSHAWWVAFVSFILFPLVLGGGARPKSQVSFEAGCPSQHYFLKIYVNDNAQGSQQELKNILWAAYWCSGAAALSMPLCLDVLLSLRAVGVHWAMWPTGLQLQPGILTNMWSHTTWAKRRPARGSTERPRFQEGQPSRRANRAASQPGIFLSAQQIF